MSLNRGDFDVIEFNKRFEQEKELTKTRIKELEQERLNKLNVETKEKKITELTVVEILIGIKDAWFDLIDDLLQQRFSINTFTKNNRLFYIGATIAIIAIILYLYELFTTEPMPKEKKKIIQIYHMQPAQPVQSPQTTNLEAVSESANDLIKSN